MVCRPAEPARFLVRLPRMLALVIALACQIASGAVPPAEAGAVSASEALAAATVLCQPGHHPSEHTPAPHHHATDSALLRAAAANASDHALAAATPVATPTPFLTRIGAVRLPPARAPPAAPLASAYPRGPPLPV